MRSGPTPAPLSGADLPPMGPMGGNPMGSADFSLVTFLNEIATFVPPTTLRLMWGYLNRLSAVGKFDPRQASAEIDRINSFAILVKMSVPKRKITSKFLLDLENFIDLAKKATYRSTIPRNERELLACLAPWEPIYTPNGMKYACELVEGEMTLAGKVEGLTEFTDELFTLHSRSYGLEVTANGEHPFWLESRYAHHESWVPLHDIYRGIEEIGRKKYLSHPQHMSLIQASTFKFNEISLGTETARLLGYVISDGTWKEINGRVAQPSFTNTNMALVEDVAGIAKKLNYRLNDVINVNRPEHWLEAHTIYLNEHENRSPQSRISAITMPMTQLVKDLGLMNKSSLGGLQVLPENELIEFVRGVFNGDGTINRHKIAIPSVNFSMGISERRADEFQFILWRLGINSLVYSRMQDNSTCPEYYTLVSTKVDVEKILTMLEDRKYPDIFKVAREEMETRKKPYHPHKIEKSSLWLPVTGVKKVGSGRVIGWQTNPTHTIIGRLGLLTHNTSVSEVVSAPRTARKRFLGFV